MTLYIVLVLMLSILAVVAVEKSPQRSGDILVARKPLFSFSGSRRNVRILVCVVLFVLWFLTAFRSSEIGNDTHTYLEYFYRIKNNGISDDLRLEHGYQALCVFIGMFTDNAQWLLIICATVCYGGVGIYILLYSKNETVSLVLLFCTCFSIFTSMLRQNIAMVICLYAYQAIKNRKNICAFLLIILAMTFHRSAAVMLLLFFHKLFRFKINTILIIACLFIVLGVSGLAQNIAKKFAFEYSIYFNSQYARSGWLAVSVDVLRSLLFFLFIYFAYGTNRKENSLVIANFSALLLICCLGYMVNLFTRAAQYFLLPAIVEVPNAFRTGKIKDGKMWLSLICLGYLAYFIVVLVLRPEWNNLYPYNFFWN